MANIFVPEAPDFSTVMRQLEQTDPAAAELLNIMFARLIQNDAFLKIMIDNAVSKTVHKHVSDGKDRLVDLISLLVSEGDTVGSVLISNEKGTKPVDIPSVFTGSVFCEYKSYSNGYVEVILSDEESNLSYINKFIYENSEWQSEWMECINPHGYLPKNGGSVFGPIRLSNGERYSEIACKEDGVTTIVDCENENSENKTFLEIGKTESDEMISVGLQTEEGVQRYEIYGKHNIDKLKKCFAQTENRMTIRTGTTPPSDDIGEDGDIYIQIIE